MMNSNIISGDILDNALKGLLSDEKLRSSTLRSSIGSSDLESFFNTAPAISEVEEEEAFEDFWEEETTVQVTKLQTVLSGGKLSSSCSTLPLDETNLKTVIIEETNSDDTTVEWTKEVLQDTANITDEETLEWEDGEFSDARHTLENDMDEETIMYVPEKKRKLGENHNNYPESKRLNGSKQLQREILLSTQGKYMKESNILAGNATINQQQGNILLNTKEQFMKKLNTLAGNVTIKQLQRVSYSTPRGST